MTTKDFQNRGLLRIFLSYFKPHRRLFALDMTCAFLIAVVDLAFPLVSRTALYTWLPEKQFRVFFVVMALVVAAYVLRSGLYFVVAYWGFVLRFHHFASITIIAATKTHKKFLPTAAACAKRAVLCANGRPRKAEPVL